MKKSVLLTSLLSGVLVFGLSAQICDEKKLVKLKEDYPGYEEKLDFFRHKFEQHPSSYFSFGANFCMSCNEVKKKYEEKFKKMKREGKIIAKEKFEKIYRKYHQLLRGYEMLDRIGGAEYLSDKINGDAKLKQFAVPDYVIVADDPDKINVRLIINSNVDSVLIGELINAKIYFKKIEGDGRLNILTKPDQQLLHEKTGFIDLNIGNIIKEKETGIYYIVDTELKSFYLPVPLVPSEPLIFAGGQFSWHLSIKERDERREKDEPELHKALSYVVERFSVFNSNMKMFGCGKELSDFDFTVDLSPESIVEKGLELCLDEDDGKETASKQD